MVVFGPSTEYRVSKRGLLIADSSGDTVLVEHPASSQLPSLLADDPSPEELARRLGPPRGAELVDELVRMGILVHPTPGLNAEANLRDSRPVSLSRSGLMIAGIGIPAIWINRHLLPALLTLPGRITIGVVVAAGVVALLIGRPDIPTVSDTPALEAVIMLASGLALTVLHELAHAVALVHFGRLPRRAGFGFYWGAVSFFVDSTPAMTLPRRARVIQALAGLATDVVTTAMLAIAAHLVADELIAIILWRLAVLGVLDIVVNLAPILEVDGHWALADLLDEPDLAPRARRALGAALRNRLSKDDRWLAVYGAFSLIAGLTLICLSVAVYWAVAGDLVIALFAGNPAEIALGVYYIGPVALGLLLSTLGLILETRYQPQQKGGEDYDSENRSARPPL